MYLEAKSSLELGNVVVPFTFDDTLITAVAYLDDTLKTAVAYFIAGYP
jgi:hypothetical protein